MATVLNIIHSLTAGGAARTMIATAKYSARLSAQTALPFHHRLAVLDIKHTSPAAARFAIEQGIELVPARTTEELHTQIADADIVQVNWWQHPDMDLFLRSALPPCRLLGWLHVAGDYPPQVITDELVEIFDLALGGSPYTGETPAFNRLPTAIREDKTGFVTGGADFERLENFSLQPHEGFNVGYLGTVNTIKMHPDFIPMHLGLQIPQLKVIVCGGDQQEELLQEARSLGIDSWFSFPGYVDDIASVLAQCDVYGYPLCEETYAASELNLQEAMYAGVPPVVFPHGGIKRLVIHNETGLVANSNEEYRNHIQFLYENPLERKRLGQNAKEYAVIHFGAENNAAKINRYYEHLLKKPKRDRSWRGSTAPGTPPPHTTGARIFLDSLGGLSPHFEQSYLGTEISELFQAEERILNETPLMRLSAVLTYHGRFPNDPYLNLWAGLVSMGAGQYVDATGPLLFALQNGVGHHTWRVLWYLALVSLACENLETLEATLEQLRKLAPNFSLADELHNRVKSGRCKLRSLSLIAPRYG